MTGRTPAFLFFARDLRTRESLLSTAPLQSNGISAEEEFKKRSSFQCRKYLPGDCVLYRKGRRCPFMFSGRVLRQVSFYSHLIEDASGFSRVYNQCDLKPSLNFLALRLKTLLLIMHMMRWLDLNVLILLLLQQLFRASVLLGRFPRMFVLMAIF